MSNNTPVALFGHSFPARLLREASRRQQRVRDYVGLSDGCDLFVDGHPGLSYDRYFGNIERYCRQMSSRRIDILCVDMGTNDLCVPDITPVVLVDKTRRFIECLSSYGISPRRIVLFTVIQRSRLSRAGQVTLNTFNHRAKQFNSLLAQRMRAYPNVHVFQQRRVNHPRYLVDGCHLTLAGLHQYCQGIREVVLCHRRRLNNET